MAIRPLDLVRQMAQILEDLEIAYALGGSLASSLSPSRVPPTESG
ncbi:MAG TPA: hypothetical protein VFF40_07935 [Acidimicrobiia bacterium]|nr:hypothetical protein [Acidimicrobiia bacterium]